MKEDIKSNNTDLLKVEALFDSKRYSEALSILDTIEEVNESVLFYKGFCLYKIGFSKEAYDLLKQKLNETDHYKGHIMVLLGMISYEHKLDYDEAFVSFKDAVPNIDDDIIETAFNYMGCICCAEGLYEDAINIIYKSNVIKNPNSVVLFYLGLSYLMTKMFNEARSTFTEFINVYNDHCGATFILENIKTENNANDFFDFIKGEQINNQTHLTKRLSAKLSQNLVETQSIRDYLRINWQVGSFLNDLDGLIIYSIVKTLRPKTVIEFSPYNGCSTIYIYKALQDNGLDFDLATFDLKENKDFTNTMRHFGYPVKVIEGDAIKTVPNYLRKNNIEGKVDLCLIDSEHTYEFAKQYIKEIIPLLGKNCMLMFHDMLYKPQSISSFSHYEQILSSSICGYFVSLGEAEALKEFFSNHDEYTLWSTHRLFGGLVNSGPPLPLNIDLLTEIGMDLFNLERGYMWNQPPMLLIAQPKYIDSNLILFE